MSKHYIFVDFFARSIKIDVVRATGKEIINILEWEAINRKQITRWQHVSRLKASSFGSW